MRTDMTSGGCRLHLDGEMTVASAASIRDEIRTALPAGGGEVEVDLSGVSEIDTAGLQIMLQLKRACGARLRLVNHSPAVMQILDLSNLGAQFGDPVVISSRDPSPQRH